MATESAIKRAGAVVDLESRSRMAPALDKLNAPILAELQKRVRRIEAGPTDFIGLRLHKPITAKLDAARGQSTRQEFIRRMLEDNLK